MTGAARAALFGFLCALSAFAFAKPPLDYQPFSPDPPPSGKLDPVGPRTLRGDIPPPLVGPGPYFRLPLVDESAWVVVETRSTPFWQAGRLDPVLTNACRLREFVSATPNRLVARFNGEKGRGFLQMIPVGYRFLLIDPRGFSTPEEIYYFRDSGLPTCQVWVAGRVVIRRLDPVRGTSLPKPDPNALAKRLAEIRSWPK